MAILWIKCFHLLAVIAWLAGIFYLPRIFVHYVEGRAAGEDVRRLLIMANRLARFMDLMTVIAMALGIWIVVRNPVYFTNWFILKILFVMLLVGYQGGLHIILARMKRGDSLPSGRALRLLNESVLLIVVPILILVIVRPF